MASEQKNSVGKNILTGTVISDKMQKTVVVEVERSFRHPLFNKTVRVKRKFKVHDEQELAKVGDVITFVEGRPVSKTKYMYLDRIVSSSSLGSR
ncbi:MAG TPA: 30S ribosomal protein S17 [Candidatus Dependentiae bacterium]|nr:30S ribosomal protein S17 [Candidatus Dependentiae bacterium]